MIYREYVEQVRAASDIVEVIREHKVGLENNMALCPFHPDSRPSLSVNVARQFFHCFGCHAGGDVFHFVEKMTGSTFRDAVDILADRSGIQRYRPPHGETGPIEVERQVLAITDWLARYAHNCLTDAARMYICEQRGLPADFVDRFLIGWDDDSFVEAVRQHCGPDWVPIVDAAGLSRRGRDWLYGRITIPVLRNERAVFLTGRVIEPDREPRYLHQTGREAPLYNEEAINPKEVFVTEGALDALSLIAWNYPAVALQGGMRPGAVRRLQRPQRVYACFDADRAGRESTVKMAVALGVDKVRVIVLPDGLDPNDMYRKHTRDEFQALVDQNMNPVRFLLHAVRRTVVLVSNGLGFDHVTLASTEMAEDLEPALRLLATMPPVLAEAYLEQDVAPVVPKSLMSAVRQQINQYREPGTQCPACGTVLQHG